MLVEINLALLYHTPNNEIEHLLHLGGQGKKTNILVLFMFDLFLTKDYKSNTLENLNTMIKIQLY